MSFTRTTTAPGVIDDISPGTPTDAAPGQVAPAARSNTAPADRTGAARTATPPVSFDMLDGTAQPLPNMPSVFQPAFNGLTGGGNSLSTLTASAADIGKFIQGKDGAQMRSYEVCAGADATAAPGIIRPANFDAVNNAVVFVER
ncbi:MAG TPA: hypothetical protein VGG34_01480 [Opitutaceae bacterium]|jgi:hypothetical protein